MSGLRIFISHSAKIDTAKTLLHSLSELLNKHGQRVLLDQDGSSPGKNWYNTLNWWMNSCDTALVHPITHNFIHPRRKPLGEPRRRGQTL